MSRSNASLVVGSVGLCLLAIPASARAQAPAPAAPRLAVSFLAAQAPADPQAPPAPTRPRAIVYSDAYRTRAKIHKYASFATLPLFAAEAVVGQALYRNPTSGKKSAHLAIATGMGVLFGVNSVTGVWNLVEARKDPHGRTKRWLHAVLLLGADAGFLAAAALAPGESDDGRGRPGGSSNTRSLHRAMAFTSIGLASVGYTIMLFGRR